MLDSSPSIVHRHPKPSSQPTMISPLETTHPPGMFQEIDSYLSRLLRRKVAPPSRDPRRPCHALYSAPSNCPDHVCRSLEKRSLTSRRNLPLHSLRYPSGAEFRSSRWAPGQVVRVQRLALLELKYEVDQASESSRVFSLQRLSTIIITTSLFWTTTSVGDKYKHYPKCMLPSLHIHLARIRGHAQ